MSDTYQPFKGVEKETVRARLTRADEAVEEGRRFVILGQGRTGSSLLCSLLSSHPTVHCEGELLKYSVDRPIDFIRGTANELGQPSFGCKVKPRHLDAMGISIDKFADKIYSYGWQIIHLYRNDAFRHSLSAIVAAGGGRYHHIGSEKKTKPVFIDLERLKRQMKSRRSTARRMISVLSHLPVLRLEYDENLSSSDKWENTMDLISSHVGIAKHAPSTDLIKCIPEVWQSRVQNAPEIENFLAGVPDSSRFIRSPLNEDYV